MLRTKGFRYHVVYEFQGSCSIFGHESCLQDREVSIDTAKFEGVFLKIHFKDALDVGATMILRCEIWVHYGKSWCALMSPKE